MNRHFTNDGGRKTAALGDTALKTQFKICAARGKGKAGRGMELLAKAKAAGDSVKGHGKE